MKAGDIAYHLGLDKYLKLEKIIIEATLDKGVIWECSTLEEKDFSEVRHMIEVSELKMYITIEVCIQMVMEK